MIGLLMEEAAYATVPDVAMPEPGFYGVLYNYFYTSDLHAVGGQLGLTYVPWFASLNVWYFGEFAAQNRL